MILMIFLVRRRENKARDCLREIKSSTHHSRSSNFSCFQMSSIFNLLPLPGWMQIALVLAAIYWSAPSLRFRFSLKITVPFVFHDDVEGLKGSHSFLALRSVPRLPDVTHSPGSFFALAVERSIVAHSAVKSQASQLLDMVSLLLRSASHLSSSSILLGSTPPRAHPLLILPFPLFTLILLPVVRLPSSVPLPFSFSPSLFSSNLSALTGAFLVSSLPFFPHRSLSSSSHQRERTLDLP